MHIDHDIQVNDATRDAAPAATADAGPTGLLYCGLCRDFYEICLPATGVARCPVCWACPGEF